MDKSVVIGRNTGGPIVAVITYSLGAPRVAGDLETYARDWVNDNFRGRELSDEEEEEFMKSAPAVYYPPVVKSVTFVQSAYTAEAFTLDVAHLSALNEAVQGLEGETGTMNEFIYEG